MRKYLLSMSLAFGCALAICAAPLTPEQALQRASTNGSKRIAAKTASAMKLTHTISTEAGIPAMYIFDAPSDSGYIVLSADDAAAPMLGYADNGSFKLDEMPPQMEWWLSEYAAQIANASPDAVYDTRANNWAAVPKLLATTWDQGTPYNNLCPGQGASHYPTGCVATAMSQIMKYWNYPESGSGRVISSAGALNLSNIKFEWDNMLDSYSSGYTNAQANAVATLMQAVGYACNMSYAAGGSGALSINAATAFSKNFKYNSNIQYLQRSYFRAEDWNRIVYTELAAGRPVMYGGQSTSVGHEFVCDGYDGNGYFHFNWGWGGMSDGYFLLDALNPDDVGTGGGAGGGYNSGQDIIVGVQPTNENVPIYVTQFGSLSGSVTGVTLLLTANYNNTTGYWLNTGITPITVNMSAEFQPVSGGSPVYSTFASSKSIDALTLDGNQISYPGMAGKANVLIPSDLADGKYKVTVCYQDANQQNSAWAPVLATNGAYNYIYITKTGNNYTVENLNETDLTIVSAELTTELYYQNACRLKLKIANNSELEMTGGFFPILLSGSTETMLGEGVSVTLQPGETKEVEFTTLFELLQGATAPTRPTGNTYTLRFLKGANSDEYYSYSGKVSMNKLTGDPSLSVPEFIIPNAPTKEVTIGANTRTAFVVGNASNIPFSATILNSSAFYASDVYALIFNGDLTGNNLDYTILGPTPILSASESATLTGALNFSGASTNTPYAAVLFYNGADGLAQIMTCPIIYFIIEPGTGVNDIAADSQDIVYDRGSRTVTANGLYVSLEVYDMAGQKLAEIHSTEADTLSVSLNDTQSAVAIAVARTVNGETKTLKIRL